MSAETDRARLLELATARAKDNHLYRLKVQRGEHTETTSDGQFGFTSCSHPDCRLVREAATPAENHMNKPLEDPDYCQGCGGRYRFDTTVDSPSWNAVIRANNLPEYLCTACIVREFVKRGKSFTATLWGDEFSGQAISISVVEGTDPPAPRPDADAVPVERVRDLERRMRELVFAWASGPTEHEAFGPREIQDTFKVLQAGADYLRDLLAALATAVQARQLAEDFAAQSEMHANDLLQQLNAAQARADAQQAWCAFTKTQTDQHAQELAAAHQARADAERERDALRAALREVG